MSISDLIASASEVAACRVVRVPVSGSTEAWVRLRPPASALLLGLERFGLATAAALAATAAATADEATDAERVAHEARRAIAHQSRIEAEDVVISRYIAACCDAVAAVDPTDPDAPAPDPASPAWESWRPVVDAHRAAPPHAPFAGTLPPVLRARLYVEILGWLRSPVEVAAADARFRGARSGDVAPAAPTGDGLPHRSGDGPGVGSGAPDPGDAVSSGGRGA
jgi:hypothetical protein